MNYHDITRHLGPEHFSGTSSSVCPPYELQLFSASIKPYIFLGLVYATHGLVTARIVIPESPVRVEFRCRSSTFLLGEVTRTIPSTTLPHRIPAIYRTLNAWI